MIPIGNLYFLLCYSWNKLDEKDFVEIDALPRQNLPNLVARILINGTNRLIRQGLDRTYTTKTEDTQIPRGKFDISDSLKRSLVVQNRVACAFDDLTYEVLHNQILRTTLQRLSKTLEIDPGLSHQLKLIDRELNQVSIISMKPEHFSRVQLHRNNSFYRFLIHVCKICFHALLPDEKKGTYRFQDFTRDEVRMRKVFQDFVYNFYRIEQSEFSVSSERLHWNTNYADDHARELLPSMVTDVSLTSPTRKIVVECKYTPRVMQENWGKLTGRSDHLYQLFSYLKNLEGRGGVNKTCDGLLLYPTASTSVDFLFEVQGHNIRVVTLDLRENWEQIKDKLLGFLESWKVDKNSAVSL